MNFGITLLFGAALTWSSILLYHGMRICGKLDAKPAALITLITLSLTALLILGFYYQEYLIDYLPE